MPRVLFILAELGDTWTLYKPDPLLVVVFLVLLVLAVLLLLLVFIFIFLPDNLDELLLVYFIYSYFDLLVLFINSWVGLFILFDSIFPVLVNIRWLLLLFMPFMFAFDIDDTRLDVWSYTIESITFLLATVLKLRHDDPVPVLLFVDNVCGCSDGLTACAPVNGFYFIDLRC